MSSDNQKIEVNIVKLLKKEFKGVFKVGGVVRDKLLGKSHNDTDFVITNTNANKIVEVLSDYGDAKLAGKSFEVVKFKYKDIIYDIAPASALIGDLRRRDFTINAMAENIRTEGILDPFEGQKDLKNKTIRMVSENIFRDDPLRIVRGVRFATKYNFKIDKLTYKKMLDSVNQLQDVSVERFQQEFSKILLCKRPSTGIKLLMDLGVLRLILPEIQKMHGVKQNQIYHIHDVFRHTMLVMDNVPSVLPLRLAALFHDIGKPDTISVGPDGIIHNYRHEELSAKMTEEILEELKYSNELVKHVKLLVENHMFPADENMSGKTMRKLISRVGKDKIFELIDLKKADLRAGKKDKNYLKIIGAINKKANEEIKKKSAFTISDLKITGDEVMHILQIPPGETVGAILSFLLEKVLEDSELNNNKKLKALVMEQKVDQFVI